ncbi:DUF4129 domain-containing protein [Brevibacillus humidisoli]|uniref:DUF4129 domain-containing protein n=1 Tax=Brevibacillus humidisoli TaxID=2895522 RepID=UPI001E3EB3CD|nr:DUF4129 domain-containing protein [Brevibacillus humidisoli]UFJ40888.1 DUF4129 domain-containing protein [Brevibacillus humidisoli]
MNTSSYTRIALILSLEAQAAAALLLALRYLPLDFVQLFGFFAAMSLLLAVGAWLYQGGGFSMTLHLLLYPLALAVGVAGYLLYQSVLLALLLAGGYYWRIHAVSTSQLTEQKAFLHRFLWATLLYAGCLFLYTLFLAGEVAPILGMLAVSTLWFIVVSGAEYITRDKPAGAHTSGKALASLSGQLAQLQLLTLAAYAACAGLVLAVLAALWQTVKQLLYSLAVTLTGPLLQLLEQWIEQLANLVAEDQRSENLIGGQGGADESVPIGSDALGESLISQLAPYLTGAIVLCFLLWFGWRIWRTRRYVPETEQLDRSAQQTATITAVADGDGSSLSWTEEIKAFFKRRTTPDDPVRHSYYQFLLAMAAKGMPIRKNETSQEYLRRIGSTRQDDSLTALANRITRYYEQHRYSSTPLSPEDLASLQSDVEKLRKLR